MPTKIILDENAYEDLMKKINALDWAMPTGTRWNITYDFNQDFIKRLPSLLFASYWKCQDWENIVFSDCASLFLYLHWLLQINSATIFTLIFQGHLMTSLFHKQVNIIPWNSLSFLYLTMPGDDWQEPRISAVRDCKDEYNTISILTFLRDNI